MSLEHALGHRLGVLGSTARVDVAAVRLGAHRQHRRAELGEDLGRDRGSGAVRDLFVPEQMKFAVVREDPALDPANDMIGVERRISDGRPVEEELARDLALGNVQRT
jgi:hypothetical protein